MQGYSKQLHRITNGYNFRANKDRKKNLNTMQKEASSFVCDSTNYSMGLSLGTLCDFTQAASVGSPFNYHVKHSLCIPSTCSLLHAKDALRQSLRYISMRYA
ncbi:hypothetical protein AVEN_206572-1 [Araneus ventricosus]|uniref:Uncharacterized protein n=1 Tax=Araneus ventricosus TaxID=182803 RepID=A0A4Y2M4R9_ARAVE|nr:hypothetical protein AVEN_206572-1 [Araneus ventricosus]